MLVAAVVLSSFEFETPGVMGRVRWSILNSVWYTQLIGSQMAKPVAFGINRATFLHFRESLFYKFEEPTLEFTSPSVSNSELSRWVVHSIHGQLQWCREDTDTSWTQRCYQRWKRNVCLCSVESATVAGAEHSCPWMSSADLNQTFREIQSPYKLPLLVIASF